MQSKLDKTTIYILIFLITGFALLNLNIVASSYAISNFNAPVLTWNQARYNEPWVGTIIYLYSYSSHTDEYNALIQGKIDFATLDHVSEIKTLLTQYKGTIYVGISPVESFGQFVFAFGNNLTANLYFRYARSSLLNPQNITAIVWDNGLLGQDIPYFINPKIYSEWFNPQVVSYYNEYESYNLTRAVMYLEKIPGITHVNGQWYYNGKPLVLTFIYPTSSTPDQRLASYLQTQAEAINLTIKPEATTFGELITLAMTAPYTDFNITTFGWIDLGADVPAWLSIYTDPVNVGGFSNSTIDTLITEAATAPTLSDSINIVKQVEYDLQVELPYIINVWSNAIQGVYLPGWANYIYLNETAVYAFSLMNIHPMNSALNGTFIFSSVSSDLPRHMNPYASVSLYAFNTLDDLYDSLAVVNLTMPASVSPQALIPWVAQNWSIVDIHNVTLPGNKYIPNGTELIVNLVHNDTWIDGVPLTAYDVNFTIWWYDIPGMMGTNTFDGLHVNYTYLVDNGFINSDLFGTIPAIVWTNVTGPYQIVIYLNSTNFLNVYYTLIEFPIVPAHVFNKINPATVYAEKIAPLISSGAYIWGEWNVPAEEIVVHANLHYFRINPLLFLQTVKQGQMATFTANITAYSWDNSTDMLSPTQISNATVYVYLKYLNVPDHTYSNVTINGKPYVIIAKNMGNGIYQANINTSMLQPGLYEVVAKAIWTVNGQMREEYSYGSLNVTPTVTTTVPPVTTTHTTTSTTSTTTVPPVTTTTSSVNVALIAGIVIVIIIIIAVAIVLLRRR
ncbi:peptide ABC transporter substrate-binding protein [Sulfolobus sp. S-194]|uniref:ABC transporter substrate-binding protein n=1 Tax=Sulfolobus sp. S-194 TaxID=2512240 RepID=UPI001437044E|nr:ABC transporter substrate-binding protein [Sulfolobus sp. S-194]QIW23563.1 peptide ABC transporter substrate-binding protein [Sulfolobus sp. S-194]